MSLMRGLPLKKREIFEEVESLESQFDADTVTVGSTKPSSNTVSQVIAPLFSRPEINREARFRVGSDLTKQYIRFLLPAV